MKKVNQLALQFVYLFDEDGNQSYQLIAPNGQCLGFCSTFSEVVDQLNEVIKKMESSVNADS